MTEEELQRIGAVRVHWQRAQRDLFRTRAINEVLVWGLGFAIIAAEFWIVWAGTR